MTLIVQDDTGVVPNANGYISTVTFRAYMDDRARTYTDDDDAISAAIITASDYVDQRYAYKGRKQGGRDQRQQWPRTSCFDRDRFAIMGIPQEVKDATCEYTARALVGTLNPDPVVDPSGQKVAKSKQTVGPIDVETEYFEGSQGSQPPLSDYPAADYYLKRGGFIDGGGNILRA